MIEFFPSREIFFQLGSLYIRWYGVLWVLAFWTVWYLAPKLQKYRALSLSQDEWAKIIVWGAVGALLGGRLGYALLYEPVYFFHHPLEIFTVWQGGMASHGGFFGVGLAIWLLSRKQETFLAILDVLTVSLALALAFGRLGNWINLEIFGSNPIAIGKELIVAGVCYWVLRQSKLDDSWAHFFKKTSIVPHKREPEGRGFGTIFSKDADGSVVAVFLILYSVFRLFIEPLRDDPWPLLWGITRGQLLTLPLLALGVWLLIWIRKQQQLLKKPIRS